MEGIQDDFIKNIVHMLRLSSGTCYGVSVFDKGRLQTVQLTPATRCHNTYSVAKLFAVTAVGLLSDRGKLDLDEPVYPILQAYYPPSPDPQWHQVRLVDVMRHCWGMDRAGFLDIDCLGVNSFPQRDFLRYVLSQPLPLKVGEDWVYTDAAYYLVSRIVTERCGEHLDSLLRRELLNPLGFEEYAFSTCPLGYPMGATGMYISTEDMCKLGVLYLQGGVWEGRRLLSEGFVRQVFDRGLELLPSGESGGYAKGGAYGQLLYVNPTSGRAVAIHGFQLDLSLVKTFLSHHDHQG